MANLNVARLHYEALETYHAVVYFAPGVSDAMKGVGLKGFWMGYFAGRAAPLGPVGPAVVEATFYNFHPAMVRRALPAAWERATPAAVLSSRLHAVDAALWDVLGDGVRSTEFTVVAQLARRVAEAADCGGRPLAAAHAALEWPTVSHLSFWHAATVLREHRGDGHVAALVSEGITGLEAHVLAAASGQSTAELLQTSRRWTPQDWRRAELSLRGKGLLDRNGGLSRRGQSVKIRIEKATDRLAQQPYRVLTEDENDRLLAHGRRVAAAVIDAGAVPFPNPMGLTRMARLTVDVDEPSIDADRGDEASADRTSTVKAG